MMKTLNACLSKEQLDQLANNELTPEEMLAIEDHLTQCDRCCQLLESISVDEDWSGNILPRLLERRDVVPVLSEEDSIAITQSVLQLLGPTDDPRMLGRIGNYEVLGVVGRGGMGIVFKAYEAALDRVVAIKMLLPHLALSGAARQRFSREGQAAAAVIDDHVLPIYGVDEWQGVPYIVTQFCAGKTLQKRLRDEGQLQLKEILRIGLQTAKGLAAAHAQGLVHRDVKPSNVLLDGTVDRALLTDFGLARAADDASLTRTGTLTGTPQYMAPEQVRAEPVDARCDLFSLGCVMYAMCTGRSPFRADSTYGVMHRIAHDEPAELRDLNPDIPEWLSTIISRLMSKRPGDRYDCAQDVATLLESCLAHVQQPTKVPLPVEVVAPLKPEAKTGISSWQFPPTKSVILSGFAFFVTFGIVLSLHLGKGTLQIKSDIDDILVRIMQGDQLVQEINIGRDEKTRLANHDNRLITKKTKLAAGKYTVEVVGELGNAIVEGEDIQLSPRGEHVLRIRLPETDESVRILAKVVARKLEEGERGNALTILGVEDTPTQTSQIRVGHKGLVRLDALPKQAFSGSVASIIDGETSRSLEFALDRPERSIRNGMTGTIEISLTSNPKKAGGDKKLEDSRLTAENGGDSVRLAWFVDFSPDGMQLVSAHGGWGEREKGEVRLWSLDNREPIRIPTPRGIRSVEWSKNGEFFVSGGYGGVIRIHDGQSGTVIRQIAMPTGESAEVVRITPDEKRVVAGSRSGLVRMWDVETGRRVHDFIGPNTDVWGLRVSPNGKKLASAGRDRKVFVWEIASGRLIGKLPHPNVTNGLAFSPDSEVLATGCWDGKIRLWDSVLAEVDTLPGHSSAVNDLDFSSDGTRLASAGSDRTSRIWNVESAHEGKSFSVTELEIHEREVYGVSFSPRDHLLASSGWDGTVRVWDIEMSSCTHKFSLDLSEPNSRSWKHAQSNDLVHVSRVNDVEDNEALYNENNKRFQFALEHHTVHGTYTPRMIRNLLQIDEGVQPIGVWADPTTDTITVIARSECEEAIRRTLVKLEAEAAAFPTFETQIEHLHDERRSITREITELELGLVDIKSSPRMSQDAKEAQQQEISLALNERRRELKAVDEKVRILKQRMDGDKVVIDEPNQNDVDRSAHSSKPKRSQGSPNDRSTLKPLSASLATENPFSSSATRKHKEGKEPSALARPPMCEVPFPDLVQPSSWSDSRYIGYLLSQGEVQDALKLEQPTNGRLSTMYLVEQERQREAVDNPDSKVTSSWDSTRAEMLKLLSAQQSRRIEQLHRQQLAFQLFNRENSSIQDALKLTVRQRQQIAESISLYEKTTAELTHTLPNVESPSGPIVPPNVRLRFEAARNKEAWIRYWLDRQWHSTIRSTLNPTQQAALDELLGPPIIQSPTLKERFGADVIHHYVEVMPPGPRRDRLVYLSPPSYDDVIETWRSRQLDSSTRIPLQQLYVVKEKLVDFAIDSEPSDPVPPGQWHVAVYSCSVFQKGSTKPVGRIIKDVTRLYPVDSSSFK